MIDNQNQQALRFFLNSEAISQHITITESESQQEQQILQKLLLEADEQQLMDCLSASHQLLVSENGEAAKLDRQIQDRTAVRTDVSMALAVAETLNVIKENPMPVAGLVMAARVLAANKLKIGKLEYQGSSVFADLLSLLKLSIKKK